MGYTYTKKTVRGQTYIEITGYEGVIHQLNIPEMIDGVPVRGIGSSAFSRREDIEEVRLPQSIYSLGRYAFYNCKKLRFLRLYNEVEDYYDGVIKQCSSLERIELVLASGQEQSQPYMVMRDLLTDSDRQLTFDVVGEQPFRLTFPAYYYNFVEDVEARVLHHKIEGSGYPYRECVTRKSIDFRTYDQLFAQVTADDLAAAVEIAMDRLLYGVELSEEGQEHYQCFLREHARTALELLFDEENRLTESEKMVQYLCEQKLLDEESMQFGLEQAAKQKRSELSAILFEYQSRKERTEKTEDVLELDW